MSVSFRLAAVRCVLLMYSKLSAEVSEQIDAKFGLGAITRLVLDMLQEPLVVMRRHASALLAAFSCVAGTSRRAMESASFATVTVPHVTSVVRRAAERQYLSPLPVLEGLVEKIMSSRDIDIMVGCLLVLLNLSSDASVQVCGGAFPTCSYVAPKPCCFSFSRTP